jgi:hypothetical protein
MELGSTSGMCIRACVSGCLGHTAPTAETYGRAPGAMQAPMPDQQGMPSRQRWNIPQSSGAAAGQQGLPAALDASYQQPPDMRNGTQPARCAAAYT